MLFWCIVMLMVVFYMFSLVFLHLVAIHLGDSGLPPDSDEKADILLYFGSALGCMMTLWQAVSGGDDWSNPYNAISLTGSMGAVVFVAFITFTSIALLNIITGLFVESAMQNLSPNREKQALEHEQEEQAYADELKKLCLAVDFDQTKKLTRKQFEDGLRKEKIPRLLMLLGLNKEHVKQFFDALAHYTEKERIRTGSPERPRSKQEVDIHGFVQGCMRLRGTATSFDLQLVILEIKEMGAANHMFLNEIHKRVMKLEAREPALHAHGPKFAGIGTRSSESAASGAPDCLS
jgi:hypothetical protein